MTTPAGPALEAVRARRSWSKVTDQAPTHAELLTLVSAAGRVADHSSMRPWRIIELRGDDRVRLGEAIAKAENDKSPSSKPLRAPLLIAVVASYRKSDKVPRWEQEAVASGVAHVLSLLLDEAGWGVIWRTGSYTRSKAVAKAHGLEKNEELLGWLYVGGKPPRARLGRRKGVEARTHVSRMPRPAPQEPSPTSEAKPKGPSKRTSKSKSKSKSKTTSKTKSKTKGASRAQSAEAQAD